LFLAFRIENFRAIDELGLARFVVSPPTEAELVKRIERGAAGLEIAPVCSLSHNGADVEGDNRATGGNVSVPIAQSSKCEAVYGYLNYIANSYGRGSELKKGLYDPHALRADYASRFASLFVVGDEVYEHGLSVGNAENSDEVIVVSETLGVYERTGGIKAIFSRDSKGVVHCDKKINESDLSRLGESVSLLSLMISLNYIQDKEFKRAFHAVYFDDSFGIKTTSGDLERQSKNYFEGFYKETSNEALTRHIAEKARKDPSLLDKIALKLKSYDNRVEKARWLSEKKKRLFVERKDQSSASYMLPLHKESNALLRHLCIYVETLEILETGGTLIVDEIDLGIREEFALLPIQSFQSDQNKRNSQLIFSSRRIPFIVAQNKKADK
jgi:hypothetical protein